VPPWLHIVHFGAQTGFNTFQDVSLLVIAGRPLPPPEAAAAMAEAVFGEAVPEAQRDYVEAEEITPIAPDAAGRNGVRIKQRRATHPAMEIMRRQITEASLIQAIGRARAILRTAADPVDILLLTDVPLPELGPVEARLWDEMRPTMDDIMLAVHGMVLENVTDAANVGPDVAKSGDALRKARERGGEGRSRTFPNKSIYIRKCPTPLPTVEATVPPLPTAIPIDVVAYQREGVGRKPYMAIRLAGVGSPSSAWLEGHVGPLVGFDRPPLGLTLPSGMPHTTDTPWKAPGVTLGSSMAA
jgi:hypothetical protein